MAPHVPRPHLSAFEQRKYVYEVTVESLILHGKASTNLISVLWTRGSKTAVTNERQMAAGEQILFGEQLSLICTLFRERAASNAFTEKLCTFAAVEQRTVGMLSGMRTIGKAKVDIAAFANADDAALTTGQPLELQLCKNSRVVGTLKLTMSCRSLGVVDGLAPSSATSLAHAASSGSFSGRLTDLSDCSEEDGASSEDSASQCSDSSDAGSGRLNELDSWPAAAQVETAAEPRLPGMPTAEVEQAAPVEPATQAGPREHSSPEQPLPLSSPPSLLLDLSTAEALAALASPAASEAAATATGKGAARCSDRMSTSSQPGAQRRSQRLSSGSQQQHALEAGERSRVEAERRQLEAEASASLALQRKATAKLEEERAEWAAEKLSLEGTIEDGRVALLGAQRDVRHRELQLRKLTAEVSEMRAETTRLRSERETLVSQLRGGAGDDADSEDKIALSSRIDLEGKLAESEKHRAEVARKMTKAHKRQENLLAQCEAEIEMLSDKVEQLEEECCEAEQARLQAEKDLTTSEEKVGAMKVELERRARRDVIQPAGTQELLDQIEMDKLVKQEMCDAMAVTNEELASLRVERAQILTEKEENKLKLRRSEERCRALAVRMTKLEVELAGAESANADAEEEKAKVFKSLLEGQEARIRELERELAEAKKASSAGGQRKKWVFG